MNRPAVMERLARLTTCGLLGQIGHHPHRPCERHRVVNDLRRLDAIHHHVEDVEALADEVHCLGGVDRAFKGRSILDVPLQVGSCDGRKSSAFGVFPCLLEKCYESFAVGSYQRPS
jgi:hypothetical protein